MRTYKGNIINLYIRVGCALYALLAWGTAVYVIQYTVPDKFLAIREAAQKNQGIDHLFWAFFLIGCVMWCMVWYLSLGKIVIDENGVRSYAWKRSGFIPWDKVREAGVFRTMGGERILFISTTEHICSVYNIQQNKAPLNELIKLGYSKKAMELLKHYYHGPMIE